MKGRTILGLMVSLTVFGAWSLAVLAQSQRHPTTAEMQKLRQEFRQNIRSIQNDAQRADYIRDRRNQTELQNRELFVSTWSKVDSTIAPFVGSWSGWEESIKIYPSNVRGRVCIIVTGEGYGSFTIGSVSNGQILTNDGQVIFKEGNYLGIAGVYNNTPINALKIPLHSPKPIERITQLSGITEVKEKNRIIQQFNAAGCTDSLPRG